MIKWILQKIVGNKNQRELRRIRPTVARIREIEEALQREPEEKLRELTAKWQNHLARYHALQVPAKPLVERMGPEDLRETAAALDARLAPLRDEFSSLPSRVTADAASISKASNTTGLNNIASWTGGVAPTSADVAVIIGGNKSEVVLVFSLKIEHNLTALMQFFEAFT